MFVDDDEWTDGWMGGCSNSGTRNKIGQWNQKENDSCVTTLLVIFLTTEISFWERLCESGSGEPKRISGLHNKTPQAPRKEELGGRAASGSMCVHTHAHTYTCTHTHKAEITHSLRAKFSNSLKRGKSRDEQDELDSQIQEQKGDHMSVRKLKEAGRRSHRQTDGGQAEAPAPTHVRTRTPQQAPTPLGAPGRGSVRFAGRISGCAEGWMGSRTKSPRAGNKTR